MTFLGLDIGGSRGRFAWWPRGVRVDGDVRSVQPAVHGVEAAIDGLATALHEVSREHSPIAAVCAMAGVGDAGTSARIVDGVRARGILFPLAVVGDVLAAAAAALPAQPGVLLWSGTGSFAIARSAAGELHRVGGRGHLLGDQGSGYDFVRRAAAAVMLAVDDLAPPTALTGSLTLAFQAPAPARLGAVMQQLDSGRVAAQLPIVLAAAAAGDAVANEVLAAGVDALVMLAAAAMRRAGLDWPRLPIALGGGVMNGATALVDLVADRLQSLGGGVPTVLDDRAAAHGAAHLAHDWHHRQEPQHSWVNRVAF